MLIALRFNLRVDYNIRLPQNKAKTSTVASSKAEASSSFKGFGFFKTLNTTWFNKVVWSHRLKCTAVKIRSR